MLDKDRAIISVFRESVENEFYRGKPANDQFWNDIYLKLTLEKRISIWFLEMVRYEHMVHGEFKATSIFDKAKFLVKAIKNKDSESKLIFESLYEKLLDNHLQVEEISQYMAKQIKELSLLNI